MSAILSLGKLERVGLRDAWPDEASNFTPWLAQEDNLVQLGEAIGLGLELEAVEKQVGSFSADILAKDSASQQWVVVENQIAPTDHRHLGQLLTYAAGLDARIVIWIAETFRDEHRAAIDFLNRATTEEFSFFAIQIELWKIGASQYAPRFSIIAKPNEWSKQGQALKQVAEGELSGTQLLYNQFWSALISKASAMYPPLANRKPYKAHWQVAELIRGGNPSFDSIAAFTSDKKLRCEIYIDGTLAKMAFAKLASSRREIESAFGADLSWEELSTGKASRIAFYKPSINKCSETEKWAEQHDWLLTWWPKLSRALRPQIKMLDFSDTA